MAQGCHVWEVEEVKEYSGGHSSFGIDQVHSETKDWE